MTTVGDKELSLYPWANEEGNQVNSSSVDLAISDKIILVDFQGYVRLSNLARIGGDEDPYRQMFLDAKLWDAKIRHTRLDLSEFPEGIWVRPGVGILASTKSTLQIPQDRVGQILLKSSRARDFVQSAMAGFHDNGFEGQSTLEIYGPVVPIKLVPGMRIVQMRLDKLEDYSFSYRTQPTQKYMNQEGPTVSREEL